MAVGGRAERLPDTLCKKLQPVKTILNPLHHYASDNHQRLCRHTFPFRTCVKNDSRWPPHPVSLYHMQWRSSVRATLKCSRGGRGGVFLLGNSYCSSARPTSRSFKSKHLKRSGSGRINAQSKRLCHHKWVLTSCLLCYSCWDQDRCRRHTHLTDSTGRDLVDLQLLLQQLRVAVSEWTPCHNKGSWEYLHINGSVQDPDRHIYSLRSPSLRNITLGRLAIYSP